VSARESRILRAMIFAARRSPRARRDMHIVLDDLVGELAFGAEGRRLHRLGALALGLGLRPCLRRVQLLHAHRALERRTRIERFSRAVVDGGGGGLAARGELGGDGAGVGAAVAPPHADQPLDLELITPRKGRVRRELHEHSLPVVAAVSHTVIDWH
jgi:hypothetical protein